MATTTMIIVPKPKLIDSTERLHPGTAKNTYRGLYSSRKNPSRKSRVRKLPALMRQPMRLKANSIEIRIDPLVHIYPKDTGHPGQHRGQRQKQPDSCDDTFRQRPLQHGPHQRRERCNRAYPQGIADGHRTQEISILALKLQTADWAPLIHSRKQPHRFAKDSPGAASRTKLPQNSPYRRRASSLHGR